MGGRERKHGRKKELWRQIDLGLGFEELREKLNDWEEDKIWKPNGETGKKKLGCILPKTQEEDGAESVSEEQKDGFEAQGESAISDNFGKYGDQVNLSEHRGSDADKRALGNAELGGWNVVLMGIYWMWLPMIYWNLTKAEKRKDRYKWWNLAAKKKSRR